MRTGPGPSRVPVQMRAARINPGRRGPRLLGARHLPVKRLVRPAGGVAPAAAAPAGTPAPPLPGRARARRPAPPPPSGIACAIEAGSQPSRGAGGAGSSRRPSSKASGTTRRCVSGLPISRQQASAAATKPPSARAARAPGRRCAPDHRKHRGEGPRRRPAREARRRGRVVRQAADEREEAGAEPARLTASRPGRIPDPRVWRGRRSRRTP